ncbi:MAG: tetratricopeptide (TPR) repeat protein [Halioglobus sp.]|jgi:tetratricopeptide (TPR) repeat protein
MARSSFLSKSCFRAVILLVLSVETWAAGDGHAPWMGMSHAGYPCSGSNVANYGPYDYVTRKDMLRVVENAHFTPRVQNLTGGENAAGPTSDLDYTLKVIPNHHLALNSAMQFHALQLGEYQRLSEKRKQTGYRLKSPVECYLQRAINYSPGDATSRMLYAVFLQRESQLKESAEQYEKALEIAPAAQNIEYNYALVLVDLKRFSAAREIAERLYGDDFPLPGLKKKLKAANEW